ncbi:EAL domain-containing protein [Glaciecola sp. XM2]|uniref:bifunctional diguanylate cyclase/phosphodiesterase n=1 Tax=Glaciecola sp. XM2 TaxID=1914931 RepID=UPI001BDEF911|nr:EAL domain-containing protein [Glaciecola sp. XM2]MBT1450491.1 EAL domain-containing protein [Glaciecola sp. XM2]
MKSAKPLRVHVLKLVLGVLAFSSFATLVNVWFTTTSAGQKQIVEALDIGQGVLRQVFNNRESQLISSAQVLTDDFGFKQAVATNDKATIGSVLDNHGARINADLMALVSLEGELIAANVAMPSDGSTALMTKQQLAEVTQLGGSTLWTVIDNELYQAIILTVDAPTPIAVAVVGFKVDEYLLENFDEITQLNTTVVYTDTQRKEKRLSTLPESHVEYAIDKLESSMSWLAFYSSKEAFVSRTFPLTQSLNSPVDVVLSANIEVIFSSFNQLQRNIFGIAVGSLILAFLLSVMLSKKLTRPLGKLAKVSQRIANGAYDELSTEQHVISEVEQLTSSFSTMQTNIQHREKQITFQAEHDAVTQLYNRAYIGGALAQKLKAGAALQIVGINIKAFRALNDTYGHQNIDSCLQEFAKRLAALGGLCARISSSEFLWLPDEPRAEQDLVHIHNDLEKSIVVNALTISIKLAIVTLDCPCDATDTISVFRRLNIVFDEASKSGQDILPFHHSHEDKYLRRLSIIQHLKIALRDSESELTMVYQPKLSLVNKQVNKVEGLIRWNSKTLGFVPPDEFIEIAEQANLIFEITKWVIQQVMDDVRCMHESGYHICAAINLSAKDIMVPELLPWILAELRSRALPINALSFELTESDLVGDAQAAAQRLSEFREAGFEVAIDDFGTGYSSLAYLQLLPVSDLKIDKSFVLNLAKSSADQKIVQSIIALAKSFDLKTIAEGIEDEQSLALLTQYGCDLVQGYHVCRPQPLAQLFEFLAQHSSQFKEVQE